MTKVYISLGSNLGDRSKYLTEGLKKMLFHPDIQWDCSSTVYETKPWGKADQPAFLNQVVAIHWKGGSPRILMDWLLQVEKEFERIRIEKWAARTLDLDILYFGDEVFEDPHVTIPHPQIAEREFVLEPMCEIAPNFIHPIWKKSQQELLNSLRQKS